MFVHIINVITQKIKAYQLKDVHNFIYTYNTYTFLFHALTFMVILYEYLIFVCM